MKELLYMLPRYEGKYIGFREGGDSPFIGGWWMHDDGEEGGYLEINTKNAEVNDFDGDFDLPPYVREELQSIGISVNF